MYRGFNLIENTNLLNDLFRPNSYLTYDPDQLLISNIIESTKLQTKRKLEYYLLSDNSLDGSQIMSDWFPVNNYDVFISHSHNDEKLTIALATWLYKKFGIRSFIDSMIWGYVNDLLKDIDNKYCFNKNTGMYDYDKRNYSTSHVHIMLNMALNEVMNRSECLIFLNTPSSLTIKDSISQKTISPWIYSELCLSKTMQKIKPNRPTLVEKAIREKFATDSYPLTVAYNADTDHLHKLDLFDLKRWSELYNNKKNEEHSLDVLYKYINAKSYGSNQLLYPN